MEYKKKSARIEIFLFEIISILAFHSKEKSANKYIQEKVFINITKENFNEIEKEIKGFENDIYNTKLVKEFCDENYWDINNYFVNPFRKSPKEDYLCEYCNERYTEEENNNLLFCTNCNRMVLKQKPFTFRIENEAINQYEKITQEDSQLTLTRIFKVMMIYHIYQFKNIFFNNFQT